LESVEVFLEGLSIVPFDTPTATLRARLAALPQLDRYTTQVEAALNIMERCRHWLIDDGSATLCSAAFGRNDSIYQTVAFASPAMLADEVRQAAFLDSATDIQAITAFAWACALHALAALNGSTTADEIEALELYRVHLEAIAECVTSAGVWLAPDECEACNELGEMATEASKLAYFKVQGYSGELARRKQDSTAPRDRAIAEKALELIRSGTSFQNLSDKLRKWQQREIDKAVSAPEKQAILKRLGLSTGKALSKPTMDATLKRLCPSVNSRKIH
jgi:hypothetical protein